MGNRLKLSEYIKLLSDTAAHLGDKDPEVQCITHFWSKDNRQYRSIGTEDVAIDYSHRFNILFVESHYYED